MKNAGKACNNRLYRHIRTFEKIVKNYFVIYLKSRGLAKLVVLVTKVVGQATCKEPLHSL